MGSDVKMRTAFNEFNEVVGQAFKIERRRAFLRKMKRNGDATPPIVTPESHRFQCVSIILGGRAF
jgi:hypothetical protein